MEGSELRRLREEQDKAILSTDDQLATWEKFRSDYIALQDRLRTLPDKVSHPVMVPFGSKAFMPGRLVHTNEVLVLLGDNWFAERSAKQACEIIDRRLVGIKKQIEDLQKQKELLQPRVDFTSELQDVAESKGDQVEITEDYDAEKEAKWREQHRRNVQKHRRTQREEREKAAGRKESKREEKPLTDDELWARLDELEKIETERKELSRIQGADSRVEEKTSLVRERTIRFADEGKESNEEGSSGGESGDEPPRYIRFTHTQGDEHTSEEGGDNSSSSVQGDPPQITSPADVYKLFLPAHPRSILKGKSETEDTSHSVEETTSVPHSATAFSGSIVERDTAKEVSLSTAQSSSDSQLTPATNPPKRVSKFKADRQKQQDSSR